MGLGSDGWGGGGYGGRGGGVRRERGRGAEFEY